MDDPLIRNAVRLRLQDGRLPGGAPLQILGSQGSGHHYHCCGMIIAPDDLEYEVHFHTGRPPSVVHVRCYLVWGDER